MKKKSKSSEEKLYSIVKKNYKGDNMDDNKHHITMISIIAIVAVVAVVLVLVMVTTQNSLVGKSYVITGSNEENNDVLPSINTQAIDPASDADSSNNGDSYLRNCEVVSEIFEVQKWYPTAKSVASLNNYIQCPEGKIPIKTDFVHLPTAGESAISGFDPYQNFQCKQYNVESGIISDGQDGFVGYGRVFFGDCNDYFQTQDIIWYYELSAVCCTP